MIAVGSKNIAFYKTALNLHPLKVLKRFEAPSSNKASKNYPRLYKQQEHHWDGSLV